MTPTLTINDRGQTRTIAAGPPTPAPTTQIVRINPDQIMREAMDSQSAALGAYLRTIAPTLHGQPDADDRQQRGPAGLSTAPELHARNARYFVTVGALVAVMAILAAGLVQLATLADLLGAAWQLPAWLTLTGAASFWTIRRVHEDSERRSPEGVADTHAGAAAFAMEEDARSRGLIARAFAESIRADAGARQLDAESRNRATDAEIARITGSPTPAPRPALTLQRQQPDAGADLVYATTVPSPISPTPAPNAQQARSAAISPVYAPNSTQTPHRPAMATVQAQQGDPALIAMLETINGLFADCARRADDLIIDRLPWSARGPWSAEAKRRADATLQRLDPPLIVAGAGGRYRLNRANWCAGIAMQAIRQNWR